MTEWVAEFTREMKTHRPSNYDSDGLLPVVWVASIVSSTSPTYAMAPKMFFIQFAGHVVRGAIRNSERRVVPELGHLLVAVGGFV